MAGALEKLLILAYLEPDYQSPPFLVFQAYVNPVEVTVSHEINYYDAQGAGTTGSRMDFDRVKPGDLSLSLFLDGTGADGRGVNVAAQVELFKAVTGYSGLLHRPTYLQVVWGALGVRRCVLKSASITYKLFSANGLPLRAVINAVFTEQMDDRTRVATAQDTSADLTHVRVVVAGDTLPALCQQIYGDPRLYLEVARVNELDDFRRLEPGTRLRFPPLAS